MKTLNRLVRDAKINLARWKYSNFLSQVIGNNQYARFVSFDRWAHHVLYECSPSHTAELLPLFRKVLERMKEKI